MLLAVVKMPSKLDRLYEDLDDAIQDRDWEFAESLCKRILKLDPKDDVTWNTLGVVLTKMGRYKEALQAFQKAIDINPKVAEIWYSRGMVLKKLKRYPEAMDSFNNALKIEPGMERAIEKYREAVEEYNRSLKEGGGGAGETFQEEGFEEEEYEEEIEEEGFEEEGFEEEPFEEEGTPVEEVKPVIITCVRCGKKFKITSPKRPLKFRCPYCGKTGMLVKKG